MQSVDCRIEAGFSVELNVPFLRGFVGFPHAVIVEIQKTIQPDESSAEKEEHASDLVVERKVSRHRVYEIENVQENCSPDRRIVHHVGTAKAEIAGQAHIDASGIQIFVLNNTRRFRTLDDVHAGHTNHRRVVAVLNENTGHRSNRVIKTEVIVGEHEYEVAFCDL